MKSTKRVVLVAAVILLTAPLEAADVKRYTFAAPAGVTYPTRIPQFIIVDLEADLPTNDVAEGDIAYAKDSHKIFKRAASTWDEIAGGVGSGAPDNATYITQTAHVDLSAEQALGALATGILKSTTTTGILSIAVAGDFPTLNQSTTGTAAALTANGGNCAGNNFALGVDAAGVGECAQPTFSNLSGSATDAQVPNTITVDLATLATTATTANAGDSATAFFPAGAIEIARGGTGAAPGADDQVLVSDSTSAATWRSVPDCGEAGTLNYTAATNTFSCLTDSGGGGSANVVEAEVDFGAAGDTTATVVVSATWVGASSVIVCAPTLMSTTDRADGAEDALIENLTVTPYARSAGVGFSLKAHPAAGTATGKFKIHCTGA